jgi:hypothetical protein
VVTEYELYADERETRGQICHYFWLGGVVCTDKGRSRLLNELRDVRVRYGLTKEMKWDKISRRYVDAYCAWTDVFFEDPFARFSLLQIDVASQEWASLRPRPRRTRSRDDQLASAYHQFLLVTFGGLHDTKRWSVFPDAGLFSRDTVLDSVEFLFNRTYRRAFGPKSTRIIRLARALDSANNDLVQLADVLLGAFTYHVLLERPLSIPKAQLADHCVTKLTTMPETQRGLSRLSNTRWVPPEHFSYR